MKNTRIAVVSTPTLERWDWRAPARGIGGSETSHVVMAQRLKAAGFDVVSFAPLPEVFFPDPTGLEWRDSADFSPAEFQVVINYRDPKVFEAPKPEGAKWWFVAQDVDYPWTPEALAKVDRYLCLCKEHARYARRKYPELHNSGRLFISSNGILSDEIQAEIDGIERNPHRLMYASSPDRGLMLLLEQWFRIRERVPEAELHVFYGFHNMEKIVAANGPDDWRAGYQRKLEGLLKQPGVVWHDRVGQRDLWKEWAKTSVFWYPTDFPETSCISIMEAQACGAIPVTSNFWAAGENCLSPYVYPGLPQQSAVVRQLQVERVVDLLRNSAGDKVSVAHPESPREMMQRAARERFNWSNVVAQWGKWIEEDLKDASCVG